MATPAQIEANRRNALKSTGPRTGAGKTASRMNALKHGIDAHAAVLPGEDPDAYQALADDYRRRFSAATAEQTFLVETLIQSDWNRRRYARIQAELTARLLDETDPADRGLAALFLPDNPGARALNRVIRHYEAAQNAWFRALRELQRIQRNEPDVAQASLPVQGEQRSPETPPPDPPPPPRTPLQLWAARRFETPRPQQKSTTPPVADRLLTSPFPQ
jgi:hypothetical protein